jgi:hypothetical protein
VVPSSGPLDRQREHIAHTTLGLDDGGGAGVDLELAPQPQDLHIDAAIEHILVNAGRLQQVLAGKRALRCVEKGDQ